MKTDFPYSFRLAAVFVLGIVTIPVHAQQPCDSELAGEGRVAQHAESLQRLTSQLFSAYEGDRKEEENLDKMLEDVVAHKEVTFSDDEKNKMEELAQRPEVKTIIEAIYRERRAEEIEQAHHFNRINRISQTDCFFYPNPMLEDYVNKLGQSLVPHDSSQYYSFRIVNDPRPDAWSFSTGSVYVSTGLMSMLDNEAQLTYVLAHEVGHVEHRHLYAQTRGVVLQHLLEVEKVKSTRKKGMILGAIAAGVGGAIGGAKEGAGGALIGAGLGYFGTTMVTNLIESLHRPKYTDWTNVQEGDADEFAMHQTLEHNFDAREAPKVFLTLENSIRRDDRVGLGLFHYGQLAGLAERRQHLQTLLTGSLKADLEQRTRAGLQTTSPNFALLMSALKRDNGELALEYDLFDEARQNLEDAIALRSSDPTAHFYLAKVYKRTARNSDEEHKAMDHFTQAIRLDAGRFAYPGPHLGRALALLNQNDQTALSEAQQEIKTYIEMYKLNTGGGVPGNMPILYDYLSLTGDEKWSQPPVLNVTQTQSAVIRSSVDVSKAVTTGIDVKKK
jgi:predicted Zn-dependent protease